MIGKVEGFLFRFLLCLVDVWVLGDTLGKIERCLVGLLLGLVDG